MRRTKEDSEKTRDDILDAAALTFSRKGFSRSTLEEIARAAHVTRGAIYWHFKNKVEIFDALHERLHQLFIAFIHADISDDQTDSLIQLEQLCVSLFIDLETNSRKRQTLALFLLHTNYAGDLEICRDKHFSRREECSVLFARYFEKARSRGQLPADADPVFLTRALNYYIKGILMDYLAAPDKFDMRRQAPLFMRLFFCGLPLCSGQAGAPSPLL